MIFTIPTFENGSFIPEQYVYCKVDRVQHKAPGGNKNPRIVWSDLPQGTKSLALICVDDKVPTVFVDANKEGVTISKDLPRTNFYHWVVIDIPPSLGEIKEGEDANGVIEAGKEPGKKPYGITGLNDYSKGSRHGGYDGPCPPWNDEMIHEYHFYLYALDIPSLNLRGDFTAPDALKAMEGHVLAKKEWVGVYSLNPEVRKKIHHPPDDV